MQRLLEERCGTAKSMALFVLKNNPAFRFYERHGFKITGKIQSGSSPVMTPMLRPASRAL